MITYGGTYDPATHGTEGGPTWSDVFNAIGSFFGNLFGGNNNNTKPPRRTQKGCYDFAVGQGDTRDDEDFICNVYDVIVCIDGDWWDIVEVLECLDCGEPQNDNGDDQLVCGMNAVKYINNYDLPITSPALNAILNGACPCDIQNQQLYNTCATSTILNDILQPVFNFTSSELAVLSTNPKLLIEIHEFINTNNNLSYEERINNVDLFIDLMDQYDLTLEDNFSCLANSNQQLTTINDFISSIITPQLMSAKKIYQK